MQGAYIESGVHIACRKCPRPARLQDCKVARGVFVQSCGLPLRYLGNIVGGAHNLCTIYIHIHPAWCGHIHSMCLRCIYGGLMDGVHIAWRRCPRPARLQDCKVARGVLGQYCGLPLRYLGNIVGGAHNLCTLYIHLHVVDTSTQFVSDTFTAASQYPVDASPNVARLQGCHMTPGSILCAVCICNAYMHSLCAIGMCAMSAYCNVAKTHRVQPRL